LLNELCDRCCRSKCQSNALKLVNCQLEESHASDFVCFDDVDLVVVEKILFRVGLTKLHNSSRTPTFDVPRKVIRYGKVCAGAGSRRCCGSSRLQKNVTIRAKAF